MSQHQSHFNLEPQHLIMELRRITLIGLDKGESGIDEKYLPELEVKAAKELELEDGFVHDGHTPPKMEDDFDRWRTWWTNEAYQNCDHHRHASIPSAGQHLSDIARSSVNILVISSELRESIESRNAARSAALSTLLMCEVMQASLWPTYRKAHIAQNKRYANGFGTDSRDMKTLKAALLKFAKDEWTSNPEKRIGEVVDVFGIKARTQSTEFKKLRAFPKPDTMKAWIRASDIAIPEAAQRRGRPNKTTK